MVAAVALLWVRELTTEGAAGSIAATWGYLALAVLTVLWAWFWLVRAGNADTAINGVIVGVATVAAIIAITAFPVGVVPLYFVSVMAGAAYRWRPSAILVGLLTVLSALLLYIHHLRTISDGQEVVVVAALGIAAIVVRRLVGARAELEASQAEIRHLAAIEARTRLAQDLHDKLGQELTVVVMQGELLTMDLAAADLPELEHRSRALVDTTRHSLELMRELVTSVRSTGLASELELARHTLQTCGITCTTSGAIGLPTDVDTAFGWVVREATTNILRHSRASAVEIAVAEQPSHITLTIRDDGDGVSMPSKGNGLTSIDERIDQLGGQVDLTSRPGHGFTLTATVPVTR